jgi:hypothetical protein
LKKKISRNVSKTFNQTWLMYTSLDHSVTTSVGGGGGGGGAVVRWWWRYQQNIPFWNDCLVYPLVWD